MLIVRNNLIPVKGFSAIMLFGILFIRKDVRISETLINHESIHCRQMLEMAVILFYIWYVLEWLIKLPFYGKQAYYNISFEREAYMYERDSLYLKRRKFWSFLKFL